jgi:hypothetical protein
MEEKMDLGLIEIERQRNRNLLKLKFKDHISAYYFKTNGIYQLNYFKNKCITWGPINTRKAEEWYFVGYGQYEGSKGWKLLDIKSDRIKIASEVTFLKSACYPTFNENRKMETYEDDEEFSFNTDNFSRASTEYDWQQSSHIRGLWLG